MVVSLWSETHDWSASMLCLIEELEVKVMNGVRGRENIYRRVGEGDVENLWLCFWCLGWPMGLVGFWLFYWRLERWNWVKLEACLCWFCSVDPLLQSLLICFITIMWHAQGANGFCFTWISGADTDAPWNRLYRHRTATIPAKSSKTLLNRDYW